MIRHVTTNKSFALLPPVQYKYESRDSRLIDVMKSVKFYLNNGLLMNELINTKTFVLPWSLDRVGYALGPVKVWSAQISTYRHSLVGSPLFAAMDCSVVNDI